MRPRAPLTTAQIAAIRRLWATGITQGEICQAVGCGIDRLRAALRSELADLPSRPRRVNSGRRVADPTPEDIRAATAQIRAGWPEARWLPEPEADFEIAAL